MASPKNTKRSQESFGFMDEDRKNPNHDQIVKWIHNNLQKCAFEALKSCFKDEKTMLNQLDKIVLEPPIWEYRIVSEGKTSIIKGFIDLAVRYRIGTYIPEDNLILFEAKTSIPSVGTLIREIQFYKFYKGGIYVVVSSDDSEATLLNSQRIQFIKYNPN